MFLELRKGTKMIKVIGKDDSVVKRVTCRNCSSILEYTPYDTQKRIHKDISGCTDIDTYIVCPTCMYEVTISSL